MTTSESSGTITLGNGANDTASVAYIYGTTIKLGDGPGDMVSAGRADNDIITLGTGAGDSVFVQNSLFATDRQNYPRQRRR